MKFEYKDKSEDTRKPVAWLFKMKQSKDKFALCIATADPNRFIWAYSDGMFTVQQAAPPDDEEALKVFFKGDSVTITF